jgi:hypothetical protein
MMHGKSNIKKVDDFVKSKFQVFTFIKIVLNLPRSLLLGLPNCL